MELKWSSEKNYLFTLDFIGVAFLGVAFLGVAFLIGVLFFGVTFLGVELPLAKDSLRQTLFFGDLVRLPLSEMLEAMNGFSRSTMTTAFVL